MKIGENVFGIFEFSLMCIKKQNVLHQVSGKIA